MDVVLRRRKDNLSRLVPSLRRELEGGLNEGADLVLRRAKANIEAMGAVDTGEMLNSGVVQSAGTLARRVAFVAEHALYVHEGHHTRSGSFVAGRPYLSTAVDQERNQIERLAADAVERVAR